MKKILVIAAAIILSILNPAQAQAPQGFTYQAAVRNNDGTAVANRQVSVRIALVQGNALGVERYAELHSPTTDAAGLFTIVVGQGMALVNCMMQDCIDWADGPWFLRLQVDPEGGQNFPLNTTQQLMSVPYALYAANAGGRDTVHIRDSVVVHVIDSVIVHIRDSVVYDTFPLHPYDHSPADVEGTLPGVFSISAANRIAFSRGNLQYKASTNTWRFALHQEDMVGTANQNISATDTNWIDLFGYGTSGCNTNYQPYNTSTLYSQYPSGTIAASNCDWGVYNAISNGGNAPGIWRTLTRTEWEYILSGRTSATNLRARATVNGIPGLILLPDAWTAVSGININTAATTHTVNVYNNTQWSQLEDSGAVFLPACGYRSGINLNYVSQYGYYWSSTYDSNGDAYRLYFTNAGIGVTSSDTPWGYAVRLARDLTVLP